MSKEIFDNSKPYFNVITLGHIDHGKTTLTAAITMFLSRIGMAEKRDFASMFAEPEVQGDGDTINFSEVQYQTRRRNYTHFDCPSATDYVKIMNSGTVRLDGAILVVAATDGTQTQTKEHILLAKQKGIPRIVVFLNKVDMVEDEDMLELIKMELLCELEQHDFGNSPIIHGSALGCLDGELRWVAPIEKLLDAVDWHMD